MYALNILYMSRQLLTHKFILFFLGIILILDLSDYSYTIVDEFLLMQIYYYYHFDHICSALYSFSVNMYFELFLFEKV